MSLLAWPATAGGFGNYADKAEIRIGAGAYDTGPATRHEENGGSFNAEFLLPSPKLFSGIGSPRPYVGVDFANVDRAISVSYAGLAWDYSSTDRLYVSGSLGGAVNNAKELRHSPNTRNLGSNFGFHVGAAIGFDVTENVTAQAYINHFSNAGLAKPNGGHESTGIRLGYRF
jgi:hypothetical protein